MTDQITTPAQMREAAARECERLGAEFAAEGAPTAKKIMDFASDLIRALPVAEPEPLAVKVKPLQWHKSHMSGWNGDWHTVPTGYTIRCADENGWKWSTPLGGFCYGHSPEAAKSAAEADHAARILSQIDAVPAAQVRAEALDDAAQAASNRAAYWWDEATAADYAGLRKLSLSYEAKALACTELAAAIRVMKGKPE